MCVYGIGLPFDHPIWRNLPPCRCGYENDTFDWGDGNLPQLPKVDAFGALIPSKCPDCGTWFQNEHRCQHVLSADCWCEPRVEQVPPA